MKVGIVDDEAAARADIHAALDRYAEENGVSLSVEEYPGAGAFLAARNNSYDILFLDIDMPGMSGMELAESLRLTGSAVSIIFCTNLEQFAVDGYKVSATGFLVKPVRWYPFQLFFRRALIAADAARAAHSLDAGRRIVIKDGGTSQVVRVSQIRYVEVRKHTLHYAVRPDGATEDVVLRERGTMQSAESSLAPYGFARCSASFLVNLRYVTATRGTDVHLGDVALPIGRTFRDSFRRELLRYLATSDWEGAAR